VPAGFTLALDLDTSFRGDPSTRARGTLAVVASDEIRDLVIVRMAAGERAFVQRSGRCYADGTFYALDLSQSFGNLDFAELRTHGAAATDPASVVDMVGRVPASLRLDPTHGACVALEDGRVLLRLSDGAAVAPASGEGGGSGGGECRLRMRATWIVGEWIYVRRH
jgi:hypothetical protein